MMKRLAMMAGTLVLGIAGTGLAATPAWASNSSTGGCVTVFVEYQSLSQSVARVAWVESRDACSGRWGGHFQTHGVNSADTNPVRTHRVYINRDVVKGGCFEGVAWRNDGGGRYFELGRTCTRVL